ncbi:hypothetical protein AB0A77_28395 [Streptomyces varsoviensis]
MTLPDMPIRDESRADPDQTTTYQPDEGWWRRPEEQPADTPKTSK